MSIDFDEKNNLIQEVDVFQDSLAREKNRRLWAIPELCNQDLRPGDIIEILNQRTGHVVNPARASECSPHPHEERA